MLILLAGLIMGACGSDDDNDNNSTQSAYTETTISEAPVWQMDWIYNQERPDWTEPDGNVFENWTILMVGIEEELKPYVSEGDMMALFINDELRGLASPAVSVDGSQADNTMFVIKAYGNESEAETVSMALRYYSVKLKHIFTLADHITLNSDMSIGIYEDYIPEFTFGSAKYPVVKVVSAEGLLTKAGITPAAGNQIAAFMGDECRGQATLSASGTTQLIIYGRSAGESLALRYYDAASSRLFTVANAVSL